MSRRALVGPLPGTCLPAPPLATAWAEGLEGLMALRRAYDARAGYRNRRPCGQVASRALPSAERWALPRSGAAGPVRLGTCFPIAWRHGA
jgi:hypothetical protein